MCIRDRTGGDRAGVLESSFVAEVKSDLMGEQTILCGMLQAGSIVCYDKLVADGKDPAYAGKLIQYGCLLYTSMQARRDQDKTFFNRTLF